MLNHEKLLSALPELSKSVEKGDISLYLRTQTT